MSYRLEMWDLRQPAPRDPICLGLRFPTAAVARTLALVSARACVAAGDGVALLGADGGATRDLSVVDADGATVLLYRVTPNDPPEPPTRPLPGGGIAISAFDLLRHATRLEGEMSVPDPIHALAIHLRGDPDRPITFEADEARALLHAAVAGASPRERVRDAELIEELAAALGVLLYAASNEAGIDPQAWRQANRALRHAGRPIIHPPEDHAASWLATRQEIDNR